MDFWLYLLHACPNFAFTVSTDQNALPLDISIAGLLSYFWSFLKFTFLVRPSLITYFKITIVPPLLLLILCPNICPFFKVFITIRHTVHTYLFVYVPPLECQLQESRGSN